MAETDPTIAKYAAQFRGYDVEKSRDRYSIVDRRTNDAVAPLRPIEETDWFELFNWSRLKERSTTFEIWGA